MAVKGLENVEPAKVFYYFEQLNNIPRGSGNEKAVSDYLVSFAQEHNFEYVQDQANNVIIKVPATPGYENSDTVVIQGHMDMVCEKAPDSDHDFLTDPIEMHVEDDWIYANNTTLGADNGIAVAMGLAVADSNDIPHPPLELLITTSEETGMDGAHALDPSLIQGRMLINIDSEEEGVLTVGCAGGCSVNFDMPIVREKMGEGLVAYKIFVGGLKGGHSGIEINKQLGNASKLVVRVVDMLRRELEIQLVSVDGGTKHNAIVREAQAVVAIKPEDDVKLREICAEAEKAFKAEYRVADPDVFVQVEKKNCHCDVMAAECADAVINFLYVLPNGVQSVSKDIEGLVESSLNLGVVATKEDSIHMLSSIRSSVRSLKEDIHRKVELLATICGITSSVEGGYPEWNFNPNSKIRDTFVEYYEKLFGKTPEVTTIHAGLECALFDEKFNGEMDMISLGPDMVGVHTAQEHLSISSTQRTWKYLCEVLKSLK